jgi:hypothetical protein
VRAFVAWADANFEGLTRLRGVDPILSQYAAVEEGVAGPIREFDEPEALVGIEPLDDCSNWRTRWGF